MEDKCDLSKLKKKKRKNSRTKGNTFERKITKILNDRFGTEEFCRSPGSGAFATTHKLPRHLKVYGDLLTPQHFKFVIECKKGYNKENLGSFFSKKSDLWSFIRQATRDSEHSSKNFLLVFEQDRKNTLCIYKKGTFNGVEGLTIEFDNYCCSLFEEVLRLQDSFFIDPLNT